jgi:hypothetical protein
VVITDFKKLPKQIIVDLINYDNDTSLEVDLLTFGKPVVTKSRFNTSLVVTSVPDSHYIGSVTLKYDRIDIGSIIGNNSVNIPVGAASRVSDLIPQINDHFGINLTPDDYIDNTLPVLSNNLDEVKSFNITMHPNSLIYLKELNLYAVRSELLLSSVVTRRILNGFKYTEPARYFN